MSQLLLDLVVSQDEGRSMKESGDCRRLGRGLPLKRDISPVMSDRLIGRAFLLAVVVIVRSAFDSLQ